MTLSKSINIRVNFIFDRASRKKNWLQLWYQLWSLFKSFAFFIKFIKISRSNYVIISSTNISWISTSKR